VLSNWYSAAGWGDAFRTFWVDFRAGGLIWVQICSHR
jgi:hypothetical protein